MRKTGGSAAARVPNGLADDGARSPALALACWLALAIAAGLLAGAHVAQYGFGLHPCQMCMWQRYAHFAALVPALIGLVVLPRPLWPLLAALAIAMSGAIGAFHAGVEYGWWPGLTGCAAQVSGPGNALENILAAPIIRCDIAPWEFLGVSMAGWNALFSLGGAMAILILVVKDAKAR